ncbi:MAG: mechanosensitive ion channel family protein [Methanomassiliicoccales archaeon]|nr:mechanosensitive ion channel family protein [Methanomassiliicoccales archaeon]
MKRAVNLLLMIAGAVVLWSIDYTYPDDYIAKGAITFAALAITYFFFSILLYTLVAPRVTAAKTQYQMRKVLSVLNLVFSLAAVLTIWIVDPQALMVSFGLMAAGVAIALQDVFRNIVGGLIIFIGSPYRVGDRVRIKDAVGDVIDTNIMYTTLLELREWVDGDQATGRLVLVPNGHLLSGNVYNYTRDNNFLWDELVVPVSYDNDWQSASEMVQKLVEKETADVTNQARSELSSMMNKYYLTSREVQTRVYLVLTSNYLELRVRYICLTRERRDTRNRLSRQILKEFEKNGVAIGSSTLEITKFPDFGLHNNMEGPEPRS